MEFRALMDNGLTVGRAWNLRPGVALTPAQVARLTSDIVWLVEQTVTLPDGSTTRALVPQVYVRVKEGDLLPSGALIAGASIQLDLSGDLVNKGTLAGRDIVNITADNIHNLGGRLQGNDLLVSARQDINNQGGSLIGGNSLTAVAGHDLTVESVSRTQANPHGSRTHLDRVAGLYVTGTNGTLIASAGHDMNLIAAAVQSQGSATLAAQNNLTLATASEGSSNRIAWDGNNYRNDASTREVGTAIATQGNATLLAGQDVNARAASVVSQSGVVSASAGRDLHLTAGQASDQVDEAHQHREKGFLNSTTRATKDTLDATTAQGSTFSGNTVNLAARRDVTVQGSNVVSTAGTQVSAGNNLTIEAATESRQENHFASKKTSGLLSSGGIGFTLGSREQSTDGKGTTTTAAASTVGSTDGHVVLTAGEQYRQQGSDVLAPKGNIAITAKQVDLVEARETNRNETETKFKQSGLTVAITSPVITAVQTAQQMQKASKATRDGRMKALAAASTALSAKNAYDAVSAGQGNAQGQVPTGQVDDQGKPILRDGTAADQAGGIGISLTVGSSQSQSKTVQTSDSARGSTVKAGGDVVIVASGAGKESNLTVRGSDIAAGHNALLAAEHDLNLLAAQNTASQQSTNSSQSAAVGLAIQIGGAGSSGFGMGITASARAARGKADGNDVVQTNSHVDAGNQITLQSGSDTTLQGAVARARQIEANVGGHLQVESLQDTSTYKSSQQSLGGSVTIGVGASGNLSASQAKVKSNYASVEEQSALKAGNGGHSTLFSRQSRGWRVAAFQSDGDERMRFQCP